MQGETADGRQLIRIGGKDRRDFLQNLVTNDVGGVDRGLVYAALLTPQGKYLADFFLFARDEALWLDADQSLSLGLMQRLGMYRLRADVTLDPVPLPVARGTGQAPEGAFADPRHPDLGWRAYGDEGGAGGGAPAVDWDAIRVAHVIPETGIELIPNETYPLEAGLDRLAGVDFRKGCYVGQEVTARMKHKTELKKGLTRVGVTGDAEPGTAVTAEDGREVGRLHTRSGDRAIAWLRYDRATGPMTAGAAQVTWPG